MSADESINRNSWCVVCIGDDYNWWVHEAGDDVNLDAGSSGIIDPKQVEHMVDLLDQLRPYGLDNEIVSSAFITYAIERETAKEMLRLRETRDDVFSPRERVFCLPNIVGEQEGPFVEFMDHIMAMRVKLLNASIDFKQPLNAEEIEDIFHAEQQERYISGVKMHVFDEIVSVLDYVPLGYSLDDDVDDGQPPEDSVDLSEFDSEIDESLNIPEEKNW
ncbi:MAG: hypothetical protein LBR91_00445 [Puniceicoccales bacterium]|jgi:hypothetical protein|nr:hypothetical protein [Puniceicoccales bacterium]